MTTESRTREELAPARLLGPDLLRGVGIILLLLTNVPLILTPIRYEQVVGASPFTGVPVDDAAIMLFLSVPTMTGMGMFVLAMGHGLARAGAGRREFRYAIIRLGAIGVVGLLHGLLVWWGDILFYYFIAGVIALYFRFRQPIAQIAIGASITMFPLVLVVSDLLARIGTRGDGATNAMSAVSDAYRGLQADAASAYGSHDAGAILQQRLTDWLVYMQDFAPVGLPQLVGLLLIGIGISRLRAAGSTVLKTGRARSVLVIAVVVAGAAYLYQLGVQILLPHDTGVLSALSTWCQVIAPPVLAVAMYVLILMRETRLSASPLVRAVAAMGRYPLSIYIFTSIICAVAAYGFGYYGRVSASGAVAIGVVLTIVFALLSIAMDRAGKQGPMESLIRLVVKRRRPDQAQATSRGEGTWNR
ncbi:MULTISPECIES: DUF418 domain-containing protein [unclassified Microbacterium]|uniref:DUF418 domain-containing protein n=1 Tax=unclassified Microbacterium TaxID=2609290 RepID=UPI000FF4D85E|nr:MULTISPECIES: DUF418 domain-containing protein [unclassified Microbacterium]MDF2562740.1 hypothetical protein [Microbacterium sp.]RKE63632.1 putative membrane protein YeiB [Microbacterium sp. AG238]